MNDSKNNGYVEWEKITFSNNFMFCKILETEPEICRRILEILLHIKIERIEKSYAEKTMLPGFDSKSVRFDVYLKSENRVFDVEMQTTLKKDLPKRSRYYQSTIDMELLSRGEPYSRLKESYVIFLCLEDPFDEKLPVYFFENLCHNGKKRKLQDGAYKVFFNVSEYDKIRDEEEKAFFKFISQKDAGSDLTKAIEEKVAFARKNKEWRKQYMTWQQTIMEERESAFQEGIERGRAQGLERGKIERTYELARNFLKMGLSPEQVAAGTGLSLAEVNSLLEGE